MEKKSNCCKAYLLLKIIPREEKYHSTKWNRKQKQNKKPNIASRTKTKPPVPVTTWPVHILTHEAKTALWQGSKLASHSTLYPFTQRKGHPQAESPDAIHSNWVQQPPKCGQAHYPADSKILYPRLAALATALRAQGVVTGATDLLQYHYCSSAEGIKSQVKLPQVGTGVTVLPS